MYFAYFLNLSIKVPPKCKNYMKFVGTYENYISKCPGITENMAPILAHMVLLNRFLKRYFCSVHYETSCRRLVHISFESEINSSAQKTKTSLYNIREQSKQIKLEYQILDVGQSIVLKSDIVLVIFWLPYVVQKCV